MSLNLYTSTKSLNITFSSTSLNEATGATEVNGIFFLESLSNGSLRALGIPIGSVLELRFSLAGEYFIDIDANENRDLKDINRYRSDINHYKEILEPIKWMRFTIGINLEEMKKLIFNLKVYDNLKISFETQRLGDKTVLLEPRYLFNNGDMDISQNLYHARKSFFNDVLRLKIVSDVDVGETDIEIVEAEISESLAKYDSCNENIYDGFKSIVFAIDRCRDMFLEWWLPDVAKEIQKKFGYRGVKNFLKDEANRNSSLVINYNNFIPDVNFFLLCAWGEDDYYKTPDFQNHPKFNTPIDFYYTLREYSKIISLSDHLTKNILKYAVGYALIEHEKNSSVYLDFNKSSKFEVKKLLGSNVLEKVHLWRELKKIFMSMFVSGLQLCGLLAFFYFVTAKNWNWTVLLALLCFGFIVFRHVAGEVLVGHAMSSFKDKDRLKNSCYSGLIARLTDTHVNWAIIVKRMEGIETMGTLFSPVLWELIEFKRGHGDPNH